MKPYGRAAGPLALSEIKKKSFLLGVGQRYALKAKPGLLINAGALAKSPWDAMPRVKRKHLASCDSSS